MLSHCLLLPRARSGRYVERWSGLVRGESGGFPISAPELRLGELVATLTLGQDNAFGQPLESQLRSCLLADWLAGQAGLDPELRASIYWVALLRYVGCTGHAHEVATVFGDEIAIRARTLVHDAGNPEEVMRDVLSYAGAGMPAPERERILAAIQTGAHEWAVHNFATGCEVGDALVARLGLGPEVRGPLRHTFERWNGTGFPAGTSGQAIPLAMRVVHLSQDMEAIGRRESPAAALQAALDRRDRTYDPALVDLFTAHGADWFVRLEKCDPWDAVLALEPAPHRTIEGTALDEALTVVADFVDLKSPYMGGHSRRCAQLAADAAGGLGLPAEVVATVRRAALVHELGVTAIPNSIWDKPGPLTRSELDRVQMHPMRTEQLLRRSPALAELSPVASAHHEKADGTGYHKGLRAPAIGVAGNILAAVDVFVAITTDRADRPASSADRASSELRRLAVEGRLDPRATDAVLTAAGHLDKVRRPPRATHPGGLTGREVEVLRLAAQGLTTAQIAERLTISPKTADHHIQHVYTKIGVSTRGAAALWAMQNAVLDWQA